MRWPISRNFLWTSSLIWSCFGPVVRRSTGGRESLPRRGSRRTGCFAGRAGGRGRGGDVELERIRCFLLRQLLRRLAQIGLRHLADLESSGAFDLAHERAVGRRRLRAAQQEAKLRRRVDPLEVLANDRLLHPLLAPALSEARPLQRQRASGAEKPLLQTAEHRAEADARRQENADEQRRHEDD